MSALARHVLRLGGSVLGYDLKESEITRSLIQEGAKIHYDIDIELVRELSGMPGLHVIYTPALPDTHRELNYFRKYGPEPIKRAQFLAEVTRSHDLIAVAGTHGKTTTSAMIAHIFSHSGQDPSVFLGGIAVDLNSNYRYSAKKLSIVEADEFDRSFLHLYPDWSLITNMEPDHLDIYGTAEAFEEAFREFHAHSTSADQSLHRYGLPLDGGLTYGFEEEADVHIRDLRIEDGCSYFHLIFRGEDKGEFNCSMPGMHNLENAIGAIGISLLYGLEASAIKKAMNRFSGIKRRFEMVYQSEEVTIIDDYAHHPGEISAVLASLRKWYPEKDITAVFQPHLFSRTKDQRDGFIQSLDMADEVILLDIYPAREQPMAGITSQIILDGLSEGKGICINMESLPEEVGRRRPELLVLMGAGDIDSAIPQILKKLK
jgi:UDP-N-acetylmuramate--alanine ligase